MENSCRIDRTCFRYVVYSIFKGKAIKTVLIIVGVLGSFYALAATLQLGKVLMEGSPAFAIASSIVPVCLGLIVAVACFQKAFGKKR